MTQPDDEQIEEINSLSLHRLDTDTESSYQTWKRQADYVEKSLFEYQAAIVAHQTWSQRRVGDDHMDYAEAFLDGVSWTLDQPITPDEASDAARRLAETPHAGDEDPIIRIITALNTIRRYGPDGKTSTLLADATIQAHERYNHHAMRVNQFNLGVKWVCEQNPDLHELQALQPVYEKWADRVTQTHLIGKLGTALRDHRKPKEEQW